MIAERESESERRKRVKRDKVLSEREKVIAESERVQWRESMKERERESNI